MRDDPSLFRRLILKIPALIILLLYTATYGIMYGALSGYPSKGPLVIYTSLLAITLVYWFACQLLPLAVLDRAKVDLSKVSPRFLTYCKVCKAPRPDRAHHSSWSNRCVLKMDHNCPWVGATVNYNNYKVFLLYVLSTTVCTLYATGAIIYKVVYYGTYTPVGRYTSHCIETLGLSYYSCIPYWIQDAVDAATLWSDLKVGFCLIVSFSFSLGTIMLGSYHFSLLLRNLSTMDDGTTPNIYDLGRWRNVKEVMGSSVLQWPLPWNTSPGNGGGVTFPIK